MGKPVYDRINPDFNPVNLDVFPPKNTLILNVEYVISAINLQFE